MKEKELAAQELGCEIDELEHIGGPWRGTTYKDGLSDWSIQYANGLTGDAVIIYIYAHDPEPRAGMVHRVTTE